MRTESKNDALLARNKNWIGSRMGFEVGRGKACISMQVRKCLEAGATREQILRAARIAALRAVRRSLANRESREAELPV